MSELRPQSRALLAAARAERTPSGQDRERVLRTMLVGGALASTASAVAAPSLLAKLSGTAAKWWLLGGVCLTVAGGAQLARHTDVLPARLTGSAGLRDAVTKSAAWTKASGVAVTVAPASATSATVHRASTAEPERASPSPRGLSGGSAKAPSLQPNLEEELRLLHEAHDAYGAGRADQALALLTTHRARFPKSQFTGERSTLEVLALCRAGRQADARRLADRLRKASRAATLSGLEGSCAAPPTK